MKADAVLAKYRIEENTWAINNLKNLGAKPKVYMIPMNGVSCKVITSQEFGDIHVSASIILGEEIARLPTYANVYSLKGFFLKNMKTWFLESPKISLKTCVLQIKIVYICILTKEKCPP